MLLVCIRSYLKSVLKYKFLILDAYPDTLYLRQQGCEDPLLFFEVKSGPRAKEKFWKHCVSPCSATALTSQGRGNGGISYCASSDKLACSDYVCSWKRVNVVM